jgi:hypothetical protein
MFGKYLWLTAKINCQFANILSRGVGCGKFVCRRQRHLTCRINSTEEMNIEQG